MERLELSRPYERWNLNPVRLPIPPHPHGLIGTDFQITILLPPAEQSAARGNRD